MALLCSASGFVANEKTRKPARVAVRRCRHCRAAPACRPRRLCWTCYYTRKIRERYPPTGARFGLGLDPRRRPLPTCPTAAVPGTPEKIAVLMQRAARGLELWHPDDATLQRPMRRRFRLGRVG